MIKALARFAGPSIAALVLTSSASFAHEGMWTFDNFPTTRVNRELGVNIDQAWLDHVRGAAVRLTGGCSASLVSPGGLVLTNNHCIAECAQNLSSTGTDYYLHGYIAATRAEERACPGMQAEILTSITDVTKDVLGSSQGLSGRALVDARRATANTIETKACGEDARYRCQVVSLYHGGEYKLYKYRIYSDVRLAFSPGVQTAFFGGDPDNFTFPRYDLDGAFIRLYEGGKPIQAATYLKWNTAAPKAGDPVFVAGNPGGTDRQLTISQLESQRDLILPVTLLLMSELRGRLIRFGDENPENRRIAQDLLFGVENSYKVYYGRLFALNNKSFLDRKRAEEADLRAKTEALGPRMPADFGAPWDMIASAQRELRAAYLTNRFVAGAPPGSELFAYARTIVRGAIERQKPSAERIPGFADSQLALQAKELLDAKPVYPELEQLVLEFWLSKAREYLTADNPGTKLLLGSESPESLSANLAKSRLGDPSFRKALWEGGMAAVQASDDPMIRFVLATDGAARRAAANWDEKVTGPVTIASERIAQARFLAYGDSLYPDATFTLRLSYGQIAGWSEDGRDIAPFTYFGGLFERATGKPPYELDPRWLVAKEKLTPAMIFNISTTNDIIGGNSGSPLINARGEVIGAVFDGNIHSLGGNYGYDPALNRGVSVSSGAISEALRKVYGADWLADELEGRGPRR